MYDLELTQGQTD